MIVGQKVKTYGSRRQESTSRKVDGTIKTEDNVQKITFKRPLTAMVKSYNSPAAYESTYNIPNSPDIKINISAMREMEEKNGQLKVLAKQNIDLLKMLEKEEERNKELSNRLTVALVREEERYKDMEVKYNLMNEERKRRENELINNLNTVSIELNECKKEISVKDRKIVYINNEIDEYKCRIEQLMKSIESKDNICFTVHEDAMQKIETQLQIKSMEVNDKQEEINNMKEKDERNRDMIQSLEDKITSCSNYSKSLELKLSHKESEIKKNLIEIESLRNRLQKYSDKAMVNINHEGEGFKDLEAAYKKEVLLRQKEKRIRREIESRYDSLNEKMKTTKSQIDLLLVEKSVLQEDIYKGNRLLAASQSRCTGLEYKIKKILDERQTSEGIKKIYKPKPNHNRFCVKSVKCENLILYLSTLSEHDEKGNQLLEKLKINEWLRLLTKQPATQLITLVADKLTDILSYCLNHGIKRGQVDCDTSSDRDMGVKYYSVLIEYTCPTRCLVLNDKNITDDDVHDLCTAMTLSDSITELHLQNNKITSVAKLGPFLSMTKNLMYLDLKGNMISESERALLAEYISNNPRIKHVYVASDGKIEGLGLLSTNHSDNALTSLLQQTVVLTVDMRDNNEDSRVEGSPLAARIEALEQSFHNNVYIPDNNNKKEKVEGEASPLSCKIALLQKQLFNNKVKKRRPRSAFR